MEGRRKDGWTEREIKGWKGEGRMDGRKEKLKDGREKEGWMDRKRN